MSQGEVVGGVRGGPQSQTERAERVGRVKGLQAQGRAGMGRTGPLTRPSVQLQILVIRSFLVLHLLGILGVCEEGEAPLQLLKRTHPYLQGGSLRVCPTSPTPSTHTHTQTHTRLGFRPGLQLLGHVHVFPTPICGDRSEGGTATPKEGQVTQRMREQEDTQAEGEGATRGAGDWRHPPQDGMGVRMG